MDGAEKSEVVCTTSGVMSIGGFNVGLSFGASSSGNLPLPKASSFFVSGSGAGAASFYIFILTRHLVSVQFNCFRCQTNKVFFMQHLR